MTKRAHGVVLWLVLAGTATLWAQPPSAAMQLFSRVRNRVLDGLRSLPRYTCVETITRSYRKPPPSLANLRCAYLGELAAKRSNEPFVAWDRLRLDVTMAQRDARQGTTNDPIGEIYSWAGAPRFEGSLFDLVGRFGRPIANGDFGSAVGGVLLNYGRMAEAGEANIAGKKYLQFAYEVPQERSFFTITTPDRVFKTAYSGMILIDETTQELAQLTMRTDVFPKEAGSCWLDEETSYSRKQIGSGQALTPDEIRLRVIGLDGSESENLTRYSNCRQYAGEAKISFEDEADNGAAAVQRQLEPLRAQLAGVASAPPQPSQAVALQIPAGQRFRARVITPIDSSTAAAGDAVDAVLTSAIRDDARKIVVPTGTPLRGRLGLVLQVEGPRRFYMLGVRLETIAADHGEIPLHVLPVPQLLPLASGARLRIRDTYGYLNNLPPNVNLFVFETAHLRLKQLDSVWVTQ